MTAVLTGAADLSFGALVAAARRRVPAHALDYALGAAGDEATMRRNTALLDQHVFVPRMLAGAADVRLDTPVPGGVLAAPVLVAPMGLQALVDPAAEAATAAAAARLGLGFCLSTFSSRPPEQVVAEAGAGVRWMQLYLLRDTGLTGYLVGEAERLGFAAIVCTVDVPAVGRRDRDLANGFDRFQAAPPSIVDSPPFRASMARSGRSAKAVLDEVFPNPTMAWDDVAALVRATRLPVLVKGVLGADDARRAVDAGAAGIVVSNHGGRQCERAVSSVEALPHVRRAVGAAVPVYFDSGIRRPVHAAVALALGADAVFVGRPVLMALAAGGEELVAAYLRDFTRQLAALTQIVGARGTGQLREIPVVGPVTVYDRSTAKGVSSGPGTARL